MKIMTINPKSKHKTIIKGKILSFDNDEIVIKCLIDEKQKVFEIRRFEITSFIDVIDLKINSFVKIEIIKTEGLTIFKYSNLKSTKRLEKLFTPKDYFKGMENSPFFNSKDKSIEENK